jgi:hypothetical protein
MPNLQIEHVANTGYGALGVQSNKDVAVTPSILFPLYEDTLTTNMNPDEDSPILYQRMKIYQMFPGLRDHQGMIKALAEPNTAECWLDMLLKQGTVTGGGPYTHPYTLDDAPNAYTIDLYKGRMVQRFWGCEAQSLAPSFDKDKCVFDVDISARGSFLVREISSVAGNILNLDTTYDPAPTKGLVVNDLIHIDKADDSTGLDSHVTAIDADGVHVTIADSPAAFGSGDLFYLRKQTLSPNTVFPFLFARTEFRYGSTAAAALSATGTKEEEGSTWKITYAFEKKTGAHRSGSFDPASLPRTLGEVQLTIKQFFDTLNDYNRFLKIAPRGAVVRMFSQSGYELRLTLNALVQKTAKQPLKTGGIIYNEIDYEATYNVSDGQGFSVALINNLAS